MLETGYQSDGWAPNLSETDSQIMLSLEQPLFFHGKRKLRGKIAEKEVENLNSQLDNLRLKTVSGVKELYYDLFSAYKNLDIIQDRVKLFSQIENAALSRYSTGMGQQQDVLLAQTEKYNLIAREEQLKQEIQATEAMLNAILGQEADCPLEKPAEPSQTVFNYNLQELINIAYKNSPVLSAEEFLIEQQDARVKLAQKEYFPDFSLRSGVAFKGGGFSDMWFISTRTSLPFYYKTKQRNAVDEAKATFQESVSNLQSAKFDLSSKIKNNYATVNSAEKLMKLYKDGLIAKSYQNFELALTGYVTGKNDALTAISTLKSLIDYETSYWEQFIVREKAIARVEALAGIHNPGVNQK